MTDGDRVPTNTEQPTTADSIILTLLNALEIAERDRRTQRNQLQALLSGLDLAAKLRRQGSKTGERKAIEEVRLALRNALADPFVDQIEAVAELIVAWKKETARGHG